MDGTAVVQPDPAVAAASGRSRTRVGPARAAVVDPTATRRVLCVWAHPDDESYLSAGLVRRVVDAGGEVVVLTASCGEAGEAESSTATAGLGERRRRELRRALEALGVRGPRWLGLPDGRCAKTPVAALAGRLLGEMQRHRPDLVVTFGADGFTGHPDHRAVWSWVTVAWLLHRRLGGSAVLLHPAVTREFLERHAELNERTSLFALHGSQGPPVTAAQDVALRIELTPSELEAKEAALAAHESQTAPLVALVGKEAFRSWFDIEAYRVPRPEEVRAARRALASGRCRPTAREWELR